MSRTVLQHTLRGFFKSYGPHFMICVSVSLTMLSLFTTMTRIGLTGSIGSCDIIILTFRRFTSSTALYNNCKKVIADSFTKKKFWLISHEQFSNECRKTKIKVITTRTQIKNKQSAWSAEKREWLSWDEPWSYNWLVEEMAPVFSTNFRSCPTQP